MDSGQSGSIKQVVFDAGHRQMMLKVGFHSIKTGCLEMTAGHDSGRQRLGRAVGELIDQVC